MALRLMAVVICAGSLAQAGARAQGESTTIPRRRLEIRSTLDGSPQAADLILPPGLDSASSPRPLAVLLHTWSNDLTQRFPTAEAAAIQRGWMVLRPNFRGRNDHPEACGSVMAQQDILDAVTWVEDHYPVDPKRIYLLGLSGGGHMTLLLSARHPEPWAAVSAWVPVTDLAAWYRQGADESYREMMRRCLGGPPETNDSVRMEYRIRSPVSHFSQDTMVPIELAAGSQDSVVPMRQTLDAFGVLARANGVAPIGEDEIAQLTNAGRLFAPAASDTASDPLLDRPVLLRRRAGNVQVTIFQGGHEWMPRAAIAWLAAYRQP